MPCPTGGCPISERSVRGLEGWRGALVSTETWDWGDLMFPLPTPSHTVPVWWNQHVTVHAKPSVFLSPAVQLWHWVWLCCSYSVPPLQADSKVLRLLPWHKKHPRELSVAASGVGSQFKIWELEQLSSDVVLYFLLIYSVTSMKLNSCLIKVSAFIISCLGDALEDWLTILDKWHILASFCVLWGWEMSSAQSVLLWNLKVPPSLSIWPLARHT